VCAMLAFVQGVPIVDSFGASGRVDGLFFRL